MYICTYVSNEMLLCVCVQEFLAHGFTNIVGSFFSCFVSSGSLSRSVIQDVTGGNTQVLYICNTIYVCIINILIVASSLILVN